MSVRNIPISGDDSEYERKSPLNKMLIEELWPHMDLELAWCATLIEFFNDAGSGSPVADGFTPLLSTLHDAAAVHDMLSQKEFSRLSAFRKSSLSEAIASEKGNAIPVVALSYKHLRCTVKGMSHMTISRRQFVEVVYRVLQLFQQSRCMNMSSPDETVKALGVVLWFDRMLLVAQIGSSSAAWVDRGLAPYMLTMTFLSCITRPEENFEHFNTEESQIDALLQSSDESRVGDMLGSLWMAIEFDLAYGATSVLSSADSMVWTRAMYSVPAMDTADMELQAQVRNMLARKRSSIIVSGIAFNENMLSKSSNNSEGIQILEDDAPSPIVILGNPTRRLLDASEEAMTQLLGDLSLCACLMPLMVGDHNFARMPYQKDVQVMREKWADAFERILDVLCHSELGAERQRILIDLFAPREFDNRCKGLDHTLASTEMKKLEYLGYLHILEQSSYWKPFYTNSLARHLENSDYSPTYSGRIHCECFSHSVPPTKSSAQLHLVDIDIFPSLIYPQRAVYIGRFFSLDGKSGCGPSAIVTGRCSRALLMLYRKFLYELQTGQDSTIDEFLLPRELSSLLVLHGRTMRFLHDYGCSDTAPELYQRQSDWTYVKMMEGCRAFRYPLKLLLHRALNRLVHTEKCNEKLRSSRGA